MTRMKRTMKAILLTSAMSLAFAAPVLADDFTDALTATYNTNPRIKSEREALEALNESVPQAISGWLPTVVGNYSHGENKVREKGSDDTRGKDVRIRSLTVQQPVFNGGETWARTKSAKNLVNAGQARLKAVEQDVLLRAVSAYMDVIQGQSVVELSTNNVNVLQKQEQATQDRFDVGEVTRTDVAQSGARVARAESDRSQAMGDLESARAEFERLVGYKPANLLTMPEQEPALPASLDEAKARALAKNPSAESAFYQEKAASNDVWARAALLLPSVSLQGQMERDDSKGGVFGIAERNDSLLLNVRIPLYQSGAEYSRVREAANNRERRKFDTIDIRNETIENVTKAWERLQTARATIESNDSAIKAAEVALEGVKQEQQYGARTTLDVLDAEQELFVARVNLVRSKRNEKVAVYNLMSVMGELTPENLGLKVQKYDAEKEYDRTKYQMIGF